MTNLQHLRQIRIAREKAIEIKRQHQQYQVRKGGPRLAPTVSLEKRRAS